MKVYLKRGKNSYTENKLVRKVQAAIEKKIAENPAFASEFQPATNMTELQNLHNKYCAEDVAFEEIKNSAPADQHEKFRDSMQPEPVGDTDVPDEPYIDPFNREQPIVRDYVLEQDFAGASNDAPKSNQTSFSEPLSFDESFDFDVPDSEGSSSKKGSSESKSNSGDDSSKSKKNKPEPINPQFDDMSNGKQKRSTKKFAKYIVEAVCMLAEKGFVWYANKDISEGRLAEYELAGELDLNLLITLENGQEATVKQFFQLQCANAEQLSRIDPEEKADLAEALATVLLEKGVAPTPMQELALIGVKMLIGQGMSLMALKMSTNSVLNQLREMKNSNASSAQVEYHTPPPQPSQPVPPPQQQAPAPEKIKEEPMESVIEMAQIIKEEESIGGIINNPVPTKE